MNPSFVKIQKVKIKRAIQSSIQSFLSISDTPYFSESRKIHAIDIHPINVIIADQPALCCNWIIAVRIAKILQGSHEKA